MQRNGASIGFRTAGLLDADSWERCQHLSTKALRNLAAASLYFARLCDLAGRQDWAADARRRAQNYSEHASAV